MGASLSSLFISQSYQSLIHLGIASGSLKVVNDISSSTLNGVGNVTIYSASVASRLAQLEFDSASQDQRLDSLEFFSSSQEAKDTTLALYTASVDSKFSAIGVYSSSMNIYTQSTNARIDSIENYTSSLKGALTVNGTDVTFTNDITVTGTINAYEIITTIESSSVIFSSGSNILGDALNDTQTLNGTVIVSGSQNVSGSVYVTGEVSSSTIAGIGNATAFSQSLDSRLDYLEGPFSTSVNSRLDNLELYSASFSTNYVSQAQLAAATGALETSIATKLNTSSFNAYTQSADAALNNLSQSVSSSNAATNARIDGLTYFTGSYATTGSNTFRGNQVFSGSVRGGVIALTVSSQTASMDCSLGNFFTLTLPSSSTTFLNTTNIKPGQTTQLLIVQQSTTGSLNYSSNILFPTGSDYSASIIANTKDIISLVSFDDTYLYAVSVKNLV